MKKRKKRRGKSKTTIQGEKTTVHAIESHSPSQNAIENGERNHLHYRYYVKNLS